jgi:RND family efflux transporter MFP subunit
VAERNVNVGDRVENMGGNSAMFRIVDNRLLDLTVTVPSAQMSKLRVGQQLDFTTDAAPGRGFTGVVMFINPAVESASRSAKVVADVANTDGALRGGLFVRGRIIAGRTSDAVVVPRDALLDWNVSERTASVFVVANGKADKRAVRVGAMAGEQVEITKGLAVGEPVVTRGGFTLRPGDRVSLATNGKS